MSEVQPKGPAAGASVLLLVFQIGDERYAIRAKSVVEVIPFLKLKRLPQVPKPVVGIFNYRGMTIAAVDLSELLVGRPASERLSTRIIIVKYSSATEQSQMLGLIAEQATGFVRSERQTFAAAAMMPMPKMYLGPVLMDGRGPIRLIQEQYLLSEHVQERLFSNALPLLANTVIPAPL